jgi:IPT/TIG domain
MRKLLFVFLFLSLPLAAAPKITSISQSAGPTAGGNVITIKGSGFTGCVICSPPAPPSVLFGGVHAQVVNHVDAETLLVTVPAHFPGTVDVTVDDFEGDDTVPNAYTFTGTIEDAFERVLLPLLTQPVQGQFGSEFRTKLRMGTGTSREVHVFGLLLPCDNISGCIVFDPHETPYQLFPGESTTRFDLAGTPGRFIYIPKADAPKIYANLRVADVTRSAQNFGTEIPLARPADFKTEIKLLAVPLDARFRNTLRLYASEPTTVTIRFGGETHYVTLHEGETLFDPAYAVFTDFPTEDRSVDVTISAIEVQVLPIGPPVKFWGFVSVTNNDTQLITTISPQRTR